MCRGCRISASGTPFNCSCDFSHESPVCDIPIIQTNRAKGKEKIGKRAFLPIKVTSGAPAAACLPGRPGFWEHIRPPGLFAEMTFAA